jgi:hypothetical protein
MPRKSSRRVPKQTTVPLKMPTKAADNKATSKDSNSKPLSKKERRITAEQKLARREKLVDEAIDSVLLQSQGETDTENINADVELSSDCDDTLGPSNNDYASDITDENPEGGDLVNGSGQPPCSLTQKLTRKQYPTLASHCNDSTTLNMTAKGNRTKSRVRFDPDEVSSVTLLLCQNFWKYTT